MENTGESYSGVSTINEKIQKLISERDSERYTPSRVAKLINRSLPEGSYRKYPRLEGTRRGRPMNVVEGYLSSESAEVTLTSGDKVASYRGMTFPSKEGNRILEELDEKWKKIDISDLSEDDLYRLLSFVAVIIATSHVFTDGSGRSAVGTVDVYLRKFLGKKLDLKKLEKMDDKLCEGLVPGTYIMLPGKYHPDQVSKQQGEMNLPVASIQPSYVLRRFTSNFADNIVQIIRDYDVTNITPKDTSSSFDLYKFSIRPLSKLFKDLSVSA